MAELGFRTIEEMVGQVDSLEMRDDITHWKYSKHLTFLLCCTKSLRLNTGLQYRSNRTMALRKLLDWKLLQVRNRRWKKATCRSII
jgi:glutamate synthase (NADPH/NADH) large chain